MATNRNLLLAVAALAAVGVGSIASPSTAHACGFIACVTKAITPPALHPLIDGADQTHGLLGRPLTGGY